MDKNTIIGLLLMVAIFIGFTIWNRPSEAQLAQQQAIRIADSIADAKQQLQAVKLSEETNKPLTNEDIENEFFQAPTVDSVAINEQKTGSEEQLYTLENSKIKVVISSKGAQFKTVQVKDYKAYNLETLEPTDSLYLFNNDARFGVDLTFSQGKKLNTQMLDFVQAQKGSDNQLTLTFRTQDNQFINFIYSLRENDYFVDFNVQIGGMGKLLDSHSLNTMYFNWEQNLRQIEKSHKNEQANSGIRYKRKNGDAQELNATKAETLEVTEATKWVAFANHYFSTIIVNDGNDKLIENVLLDSKPFSENDPYLKHVSASLIVPSEYNDQNDFISSGLTFYFGPLGYSHLKNYDNGLADINKNHFEQLVPLGWFIFHIINEYFVIPVFNWLSSTGMNMGLVILLLTIIVKVVISPLTYKSYMSSAKMRVLKPQVDELSAKYPKQEQAAEKQKAIMALYSKAGANPMSGCIPMLLQMPVLIALFKFFPNAIELRQKSFLWATDLSTYDSIVNFPFNVPLLGNHLSLFCILMTITNVIYTKFNMQATSTGQEQMPGMKMMMYIFPIVFLFVLNDYPSGLTYYYFISLLITILLTLFFRFVVDEEKVLAKLEANKSKPKKKSGFMARLEEAQKMQQQAQQQKNKKKK